MRAAHTLISICFLAVVATGQTTPTKPESTTQKPPTPCPQFELRAPQQRIFKDGEQIGFAIVLAGGDPTAVPTIVWSSSAGTIVSGQGTRNARLDTTGAGVERQIRADVWVGGFAAECSLQASATVQIAPPPSKLSEFGELSLDKENEELANLTTAIASGNDNAYVFGYAGRKSPRGYTSAVLKRLKAQLLANGISYERLAFIDGGFREEPAVELWIVPVGADPPRAKPTVNAKEIVFPKPSPTKKP